METVKSESEPTESIPQKFISVADPEFERICKLMPDRCIMQIQVIEPNANFVGNWRANDTPELVEMFHGTQSYNVLSILNEGLKSNYNKRSAYGKGTYFSPSPTYSLNNYSDQVGYAYVFLCELMKDKVKKGTKQIYVCSEDDAFQIKYLIYFYKGE